MSSGTKSDPVLAEVARVLSQRGQPAARAMEEILYLACSRRVHFLSEWLLERCGGAVQAGPFAGMKYVSQSVGSQLPPKLLGCYEAELHGVRASCARTGYDTVINIGCGEGYYAVGLARLVPQTRVYAFDSNPAAQELCRLTAALNAVAERVDVRGTCDAMSLRQLVRGRTLIFCDCEGGEVGLLDPAVVPELLACDLLVELHAFLDPGIPRLIEDRFAPTHGVIRIGHAGRDPSALPALWDLNQLDQYLAVWEGRPGPTPWVFMRPHVRALEGQAPTTG
jgi:hypothetical protein